jgi:hypothetical protein
MTRCSFAVLAFLVLVLDGCAHTITPAPSPEAWPSAVKSPLHAGVYYSPQFSNQETTRASGPHTFTVPIGKQSVRLCDDLFSRVFEGTTSIQAIPPEDATAKGLDVLIAPSLEHFDFRTGFDAYSDRYSVAYRFTLYTLRGVPVASWLVFGNVESNLWDPGGAGKWIEDDMNDAALKFLRGFQGSAGSALTAMTRSSANQPVPVDPGQVTLTVQRAQLPGLDPKVVTTLQEAGVVALRVTARNESGRDLVVRASDMRVRLRDGQIVFPSSVSSVLGILEEASQAGVLVGGLVGAPFGVLTIYLNQRSDNEQRELRFKAAGQAMFEDRVLGKDKEASGLVLFQFAKGADYAEGATLTAWWVDPAAADGVQIALPLSIGQ